MSKTKVAHAKSKRARADSAPESVSPELARRIRAQQRLQRRANDVEGWGYYPFPAGDSDTDPEVTFRRLVDFYVYCIRSNIVRGSKTAAVNRALEFAKFLADGVRAPAKVVNLADYRQRTRPEPGPFATEPTQ